jgi:hypothetical protein
MSPRTRNIKTRDCTQPPAVCGVHDPIRRILEAYVAACFSADECHLSSAISALVVTNAQPRITSHPAHHQQLPASGTCRAVRDQVLEITVPAVWSTLLHGASIPHPYVVEPSPSSFIRARDRPRHSFTLPVLAHLVCPAEKGCGTGYCPSLQLHSLCDAPAAPLPLPAVLVITPDGLLSRPRPLTSSAHPARYTPDRLPRQYTSLAWK